MSAFIQHPLGERRVSAHFSYFLAIKAIVFIEIQGRFGSALVATETLWRTGARWNSREVALWSGTTPWPALSVSGSLHLLLLAPDQDFPALPRSSSLPAEGIWSKGRLDFVKRNLGLFGETSGKGWESWRVKDEPTETEGKENHEREQELQKMALKIIIKSTWVAFKITPFYRKVCPGEVLLAGKDPPVPGLHFKKTNKQSKQNCVLNLQYVLLMVVY